jgi:hypothetical protein
MVAGPIYRGSYGNMAGGCLPRGGVAASVTDPHILMGNWTQIQCRNSWTSCGDSNLWNCLPDWFSGLHGSLYRSKNRILPPPGLYFSPTRNTQKFTPRAPFTASFLPLLNLFYPFNFNFSFNFCLSSFPLSPFTFFPQITSVDILNPPPPRGEGEVFSILHPCWPNYVTFLPCWN